MKNKKINILILFIMIILVLYFTLKDNFSEIMIAISNVNIYIFLFSIVIFILSLFFKSISFLIFIKDYSKDYTLKDAFNITLISQFLNGITPFQSGGQPFEIYLLKKRNIRITDSTNALLKDFIAFQIALILMGIFSIIILFRGDIIKTNNYLLFIILIGFVINFSVLLILFIFSSAKCTGIKIANKIVDFIFKFNITKKLNLNKQKIINSINHFYETSKTLKDNKYKLLIAIINNLIYLILLYIIPSLIFRSLGYNGINILRSIVVTSFVMLIGNFIPIPGATGGIEFGFIKLFESFVKGPILSTAMLLWRTVTYFLAMVIGSVALLFERGGVKK